MNSLKLAAVLLLVPSFADAGIREATVKVRNPVVLNGQIVEYKCGSATIIARENGLVWGLGCGHNFRGVIGGRFTIEAFDGSEVGATLERFDKSKDLALFSAPDYAPLDVCQIADTLTNSKEFTLAGYPGGEWQEKKPDDRKFRSTTATLLSDQWEDTAGNKKLDFWCADEMPNGTSGGGCIIDGELYGVISTGGSTPGNYGIMTSTLPEVREFCLQPIQKCTSGRCRLVNLLKMRRAKKAAQAQPLKPVPQTELLPPPVGTPQLSAVQSQIDALTAQVESLKKQIAGVATSTGERGPQGEAGPAGVPGTPGAPGKNADPAALFAIQTDIEALKLFHKNLVGSKITVPVVTPAK